MAANVLFEKLEPESVSLINDLKTDCQIFLLID